MPITQMNQQADDSQTDHAAPAERGNQAERTDNAKLPSTPSRSTMSEEVGVNTTTVPKLSIPTTTPMLALTTPTLSTAPMPKQSSLTTMPTTTLRTPALSTPTKNTTTMPKLSTPTASRRCLRERCPYRRKHINCAEAEYDDYDADHAITA